jgi:hypothetical protein
VANYSVTSGNMSYGNTLTANAADVVTFADRFGYVSVTNNGTTGIIWVTTNNTTPVDTDTGENNSYPVAPGQTALISNQTAYWGQTSKVTIAGTPQIPRGGGAATVATSSTVGSTPANPGSIQPYGSSLVGAVVNDGTIVQLISTSANGYYIAAAG